MLDSSVLFIVMMLMMQAFDALSLPSPKYYLWQDSNIHEYDLENDMYQLVTQKPHYQWGVSLSRLINKTSFPTKVISG